MVTLDDTVRALVDGRNFAVLGTLRPDGSPQTSVIWIDRDGDTLLFSITADKQKAVNLRGDGRVSVSIFDRDNPYLSAEIRGTADLLPDPEKRLPLRLSQKYLGTRPPAEDEAVERLIVRVTPQRVNTFSP